MGRFAGTKPPYGTLIMESIRDFNVHLKAKEGYLEAGSYVFEYVAYETNEIEY